MPGRGAWRQRWERPKQQTVHVRSFVKKEGKQEDKVGSVGAIDEVSCRIRMGTNRKQLIEQCMIEANKRARIIPSYYNKPPCVQIDVPNKGTKRAFQMIVQNTCKTNRTS